MIENCGKGMLIYFYIYSKGAPSPRVPPPQFERWERVRGGVAHEWFSLVSCVCV